MEPSPELSPPATTATFPAATEVHEPHPSTTSSSLFPLFPLAASTSTPTAESHWLSNPSFSFDASSLNIPAANSSPLPTPLSPSSDDDAPPPPASSKYELVPSQSDSDDERGSRRKGSGRRKRRREKERYDGAAVSRKAGVRAWAGSETKPVKDYYVDAKGDHDNLAFGSLYRMDVARYRSQSMMEASGFNRSMFLNRRFGSSHIDLDSDLDGLDKKVRAGGRYYSAKNAVFERNKGFKHLKVFKGDTSAMLAEDFVPFDAQLLPVKSTTMEQELEESWEDEILRRTKEFNKMSRERPHDEKVWLAFAQFQDKVASTQPQKASRLQTTERKISILEKAVELNPDNEELLLCLLKSYGERDSAENLLGKWEQILMKHPDSFKLWKQYLLLCQGEFSRFKVSEIRKSYVYAVQALSAACTKLCRQVNENMDPKSPSSSLAQLELGLVDIFVNLCRFEWQTGHRELATGLFQAQMEFSLFSPPLHLTTSSKQRLFEHFWNSGGARIGEDGAMGWSAWLAKDEESRPNFVAQENTQETETGGWSGWFDPSVGNMDTNESVEPPSTDGNDAEDPDDEDTPAQDDIESLLKKLGIDVDTESNSEVKDAETWNRWASMELSRDNEQWMPVHEKSGNLRIGSLHSGDAPSGEDNDQLSRDFLLCGIYGRTEAMHGNIEQARKIFDMALLSTQATTEDLRKKVSILYLWYAEMEISVSTSRNNSDSMHRAIYILSCLGSNIKYAPFTGPISRPQVLRARQGFKEQIRGLRYAFASGGIKEESIALVCSASLFESMTSGYSSGLEVIEETFHMAFSGLAFFSFPYLNDSSHNLEFEDLWVYYIKLLQKNLNQLSLSRVWPSVSQGVHKYPYNPKSYSAMLTLSYLYSVSNNLRLTLDKCSQRDPSIITLLFALSFEWSKTGSDNRIHSLFERALADDKLQKSVLLWRCYLAYEAEKAGNASAARRVFFRAIHACPWSKRLWLDGFQKLSSILTLKELSDLQEVMRDKELNIRTDIYEILLQDETDT
nr:unnamed protein product [Digitaria exilis]